MSISTILTSAAGYIIKGAAESKTAKEAKESLLSGLWHWVAPYLLEDIPDADTDSPEQEAKIHQKLVELSQDEAFFDELTKRVAALKAAGIQEKNIVRKDIKNVKKIKIGDKAYNPHESYNRKNIVEGNVEGADEFILGDGH